MLGLIDGNYDVDMPRFIDLTGRQFDMLTVIERAPSTPKTYKGDRTTKRINWRCVCECGNEVVVAGDNLKGGHHKSCGCQRWYWPNERNTVHGHFANDRPTREYNSWQAMKKRCYDPHNASFAFYGGRGITVCDRWRDSFANFLADLGPRPAGTSLDRINTNGNYEPGNVCWSTAKQQANNRRNTPRKGP